MWDLGRPPSHVSSCDGEASPMQLERWVLAVAVVCAACGGDDGASGHDAGEPDGGRVEMDGGHVDAGGEGEDGGDTVGGGTACDEDGDGHDAVTCGGDDCDDADRNRYPGATEVCDPASRDEDCNP